jgi:AraC-like DNA-binding protein
MHTDHDTTFASTGQLDRSGRNPAGTSSPGSTDRWTIVRHVHAQGGQYVESRHEAFASHPSHVHTTPTIALLLRGALEVKFASGRRLAVDAGTAVGALVLPPGPPHHGRAGADGARMLFVMPEADRLATLGPAAAELLADPAWWRTPRVAMLGRGLRIVELSAEAGVDPAHLARTFRAHYGTTAGAYLREIRVRRAAEALLRSSAPLAQIALDSGFADQSHFTRVFRAAYGVSPGRWRVLGSG